MDEYRIRDYVAADGVDVLSRIPGYRSDDLVWCKEAENGVARTLVYDGEIAACAGIILERPGIGQAWTLYPEDVGKYHIDPKIVKSAMLELMVENGLWRVFSTIRCDFPAAVKYIEWLGFKYEGRMVKNEPDQTDSFLYALTT